MPSPPIQLFLTTIASAPALRQKQEYLLRILQVKRIPFVSYDLASDPNAKRLWRRKAPKTDQGLPGILVGGVWPGSFEQFEEAVERGDLDTFLRLKEDYDPDIDGKVLPAQPVGVPGAAMPLQMQGHKPSFAPTGPTPMRKPDEEVDAGEVLPGYGFQGLKVTMDELASLAKELGLDDKEATDLAKGLGSSGSTKTEEDKADQGDLAAKEEVKATSDVTEEVPPKEEKVEEAPESKPEASKAADTLTKEAESTKEDAKEEPKSVETVVVPSDVTS